MSVTQIKIQQNMITHALMLPYLFRNFLLASDISINLKSKQTIITREVNNSAICI